MKPLKCYIKHKYSKYKGTLDSPVMRKCKRCGKIQSGSWGIVHDRVIWVDVESIYKEKHIS